MRMPCALERVSKKNRVLISPFINTDPGTANQRSNCWVQTRNRVPALEIIVRSTLRENGIVPAVYQNNLEIIRRWWRQHFMSDSLAIYLHDHLAGSNFAVQLLEFLRDQHAGHPWGEAAAALLVEVETDRTVLQGIIARVSNGVPIFKEASAWVTEKLSEMKLRPGAFGTFEALEALALGILGKLALWRALATIAETDARLPGVDFNHLMARAERQHARVEELRLQAVRAAFELVAQ